MRMPVDHFFADERRDVSHGKPPLFLCQPRQEKNLKEQVAELLTQPFRRAGV